MDSKKAIRHESFFWRINSKLAEFGTTYTSLLLFNSNHEIIYSKSSNPDWSDEFTSTGLYKKCHLLNAANELISLRENSFTIAWDLYLPETEDAKELEDIRKYKDITHGVGFYIKSNNESKILLNIAGKYADINFGLNVLKKRKEVYNTLYDIMLGASASSSE